MFLHNAPTIKYTEDLPPTNNFDAASRRSFNSVEYITLCILYILYQNSVCLRIKCTLFKQFLLKTLKCILFFRVTIYFLCVSLLQRLFINLHYTTERRSANFRSGIFLL
jgi:hypothetical protein